MSKNGGPVQSDPKVYKMYSRMLEVLYRHLHDWRLAWDRMIEFVAADWHGAFIVGQLGDDALWLFEDRELMQKLIAVYDLDLVKSDMDDALGELYCNNQGVQGARWKGQFLTPMNVCRMMALMTMPGHDDERRDEPLRVLEPAVGTGRMIIAAAEVCPEAYFYGVDVDIRALRIAFLNCSFRKVHGFFLHADALRHDTRLCSPNWKNANWLWQDRWGKLLDFGEARREAAHARAAAFSGPEAAGVVVLPPAVPGQASLDQYF